MNPEVADIVEGYRVYYATSPEIPFDSFLGFTSDTTIVHESALAEGNLFYYYVISKYGFGGASVTHQNLSETATSDPASRQQRKHLSHYHGHE